MWLATLLEEVRDSITAEGRRNCVASGLLTETQENLTKGELLIMKHLLQMLTGGSSSR